MSESSPPRMGLLPYLAITVITLLGIFCVMAGATAAQDDEWPAALLMWLLAGVSFWYSVSVAYVVGVEDGIKADVIDDLESE